MFGSKQATLDDIARIQERIERMESAPTPTLDESTTARLTELSRRDGDLQSSVDAITVAIESNQEQISEFREWRKEIVIAVSEGIERTDRAERRIKATVARARGQLKTLGYEDPGLDSEAQELRLIDGGAGEVDGVQPVSEAVGETKQQTSSVRGVPAELLRRARGL